MVVRKIQKDSKPILLSKHRIIGSTGRNEKIIRFIRIPIRETIVLRLHGTPYKPGVSKACSRKHSERGFRT